ncbi:uncharacterized protein AB675_2227 [Cyphellophora attinorum]|uniref:Thioredoxin domain-containing protein n=1 Tax=Cyphellophora attinorum TaxID=1664694 RepID=A0A0N1HY29_9EURO|nr:uncharacterized protein AB675_2227 [Phialophora attinorum]KPI43132.1 hypothetical protein AB675_2227 [Phialophora attinorum]
MTARGELASWAFPARLDTKPAPDVNSPAPSVAEISFPRKDGKPVVIAFLRHCGCPFAEKIFLNLRRLAEERQDVQFIAVSHSDQISTDHWTESIGGAGNVQIIVDNEKKIYAQYGLGVASFWHVLNPWSMAEVFRLAFQEKIKNRPTETGTRWQISGMFAIDASGIVKYSHPSQTTDDMGDPAAALEAVQSTAKL